MSADNWAICPKCNKGFDDKRIEQMDAIKAKYGKVPLAKWQELVGKLKQLECAEQERTLREDWNRFRWSF
jgi:hypothetical protein